MTNPKTDHTSPEPKAIDMEMLITRIHAALRPRSRKADGFPGSLVTQHELAKAAGVHPSVISRLYGRRQLRWNKKTLAKIDAGLRILSEWQTKRAERLREVLDNKFSGTE